MTLLAEVSDQLQSLNMKHASRTLSDLLEQSQKEDWSNLRMLGALLRAERNGRDDKSRLKRMKDAGFPYMATIEGFDFGFQRSISKKHMMQLKELTWLENAFNLLFIGPPGVGKTHLAVALGIAAVDVGYKVTFIHMERLVNALRTREISSKSRQMLKRLLQVDLVIIDEIGFQPMSRVEANDLFCIISQLYQQSSIIITSNKGVTEWGEFLGEPAVAASMLDRLLHKCEVFDMDGYS